MSMEQIRRTYGVPAKRGARVGFNPTGARESRGVIVGSRGMYLRVRWDLEGRTVSLHPTWCIKYLDAADSRQLDAPQGSVSGPGWRGKSRRSR